MKRICLKGAVEVLKLLCQNCPAGSNKFAGFYAKIGK